MHISLKHAMELILFFESAQYAANLGGVSANNGILIEAGTLLYTSE